MSITRNNDDMMAIMLIMLSLLSSLPLMESKFPQVTSEQNSSSNIIPWRQINFISASQSLAQSRWWHREAPSFSAKGMDHLYLLTDYLLNWLQEPGLPPGIIKEEILDDPKPILRENQGKVLLPCILISLP